MIKTSSKVISITIWGNGISKGKWVEWYYLVKKIMRDLGYQLTHIGIQSPSFHSGKIVTKVRKEKDILQKLSDGEEPSSLSCYSLPLGYRTASFDYDFLCVRRETYISFLLKEEDFFKVNVQDLIKSMMEYIEYEAGEIYALSRNEMPLIYAATRNCNSLRSFVSIKKFAEVKK